MMPTLLLPVTNNFKKIKIIYFKMIDKWLEDLKELKCLPESDLKELCEKAKEIFIEESNVQNVSAPVIICGD